MKPYTPRRSGLRWREAAPDYVLDCFDDPRSGDRYMVMFTPFESRTSFADTRIPYLAMSENPTHPQGIGVSGELRAHEATAYRYHNHHRRVRWMDLPAQVRQCVTNWMRTE